MGGHYTNPGDGEAYTRIRAERAAQDYESWAGAANARTMTVGGTFKLKDHPRVTGDNDFLIKTADHYFQIEVDPEGGELEQFVVNEGLTFPGNEDLYFCRFEVIRKATPFHPRAVTEWPDLSGMHTAVVTGPGGEEI
jgi:type VI secretion system secreted protein VgrG